jgi:hypothetical protein
MTRQVVRLSTLKPDELRSSDFTELSHKFCHAIHLTHVTKTTGQLVWPRACRPRSQFRFPDHARGFFYYYSPVGFSHIASSIRFRCTPSNDPATFNQGKDLLTPLGLPWEYSMPSILCAPSAYIQDYLVHAGLVTEDQITHLKHILNGRHMSRIFWRFDLPFSIHFNRSGVAHTVAVRSHCEKMRLHFPFLDCRNLDGRPRIPYTGSFKAFFSFLILRI